VPTGGTYSASKAAAWSLTNGLRTDLKKQGTHDPAIYLDFDPRRGAAA
jgi:short-subunit dehydrogenase